MDQVFNGIKLAIFDLDGTLYEDTEHFDYYATLLQAKVSPEYRDEFWEHYQQMKAGTHIVKIGKAYDIKHDSVLTLDPLSLTVTDVHNWDGTNWPAEKVKSVYHQELVFDFEKMIAIGDGWWLPFVTAKHYGVSGEETYSCYNETKEYMVTDKFQLTKTPGLQEGLQVLKNRFPTVLVTNSEITDVTRLLKELDLEDLFTEIITSAQKPVHTRKIFQSLLEKYDVNPEESMSIGDNFINEIAPALSLNMGIIFIQQERSTLDQYPNIKVVNSLAELF